MYANIAVGENVMAKLQVYDPAMCCSTGVCGPTVDPALSRFAADLEWLKTKGVAVERFNLARDVAAFTTNPIVKAALNSEGAKCLPLVLVDGEKAAEGAYPSREELARLTSVAYESGATFKPKANAVVVTIGGPAKPESR
jgi:Arsenical resistance operon protein ArsD